MKTEFSMFLLATLGVSSFAVRFTRQIQNSSDCTTPDGFSGKCINIKECPTLLKLLDDFRNKPDVLDFLRKSLCRYENKDAIVCCRSDESETKPDISTDSNQTNTAAGETSATVDTIIINKVYELPSPPDCGQTSVPQVGIVDGPAKLGAWPWVAALGYGNETITRWLCSGSLITSRHVIAPAHCFSYAKFVLTKVRFGQVQLNSDDTEGDQPIDMLVENIIKHPDYNKRKQLNDVAILRLETDVTFTRNIKPICLPKTPEHRRLTFVRTLPVLAGIGTTEPNGTITHAEQSLIQIQLPVVDNDECTRIYKRTIEIHPTHLCAGFISGGKGTCKGDSGGPLMWKKNGNYYLIGMVSFGNRICGKPGYPDVYPRITSYIDWIEENLNSESEEATNQS